MQGKRLEAVLDLLCSKVSYSLPQASVMQTTGNIKVGVFTPTFMVFDAVPTYEELFDLRQLLSVLKTIGNSPSWVDADIEVEPATVINCKIASDGAKNTTVVETLCPKEDFFPNNRNGYMGWVEAILSPVKEMQAVKKVEYSLANGFVQATELPFAALFVLESNTLPDISNTLLVAEKARRKLMGISRKLHNGDPTLVSRMFSGKNHDGSPAKSHQHAYFLPFSSRGDKKLNELLVVSRVRLTEHDVAVMKRLTGLPPDITISLKCLSADPLMEAKVWDSATPFVSSRHHRNSRGSWKEWMKEELLREIQYREMQLPDMIELLENSNKSFITTRKGVHSKNQAFFRLTYKEGMSGPFSLGSLAHFGIGLFLPRRNKV
jgi:CRISPR-associated protein Csb2